MSDIGTRGHTDDLPPEDDWFSVVDEEPDWPEVPSWHGEPPPAPREPVPPGLGRRQAAVVLAVLAVIAVAGIVVLGVRAITGSDSGTQSTTPATTPTTTPATTPTTTPATTPTTTPQGTTPSADAVPTEAVLRPGAEGASVVALQKALTALGFDPGDADGKYGEKTQQAVVAFQESKGLTADGIAGPDTIAAINTALASG